MILRSGFHHMTWMRLCPSQSKSRSTISKSYFQSSLARIKLISIMAKLSPATTRVNKSTHGQTEAIRGGGRGGQMPVEGGGERMKTNLLTPQTSPRPKGERLARFLGIPAAGNDPAFGLELHRLREIRLVVRDCPRAGVDFSLILQRGKGGPRISLWNTIHPGGMKRYLPLWEPNCRRSSVRVIFGGSLGNRGGRCEGLR